MTSTPADTLTRMTMTGLSMSESAIADVIKAFVQAAANSMRCIEEPAGAASAL